MAKSKLSGAREAPLYPKSSGVSASNENQMVASAAFRWYYSEDKKTIYVVMTDGYVFSFTPGEILINGEGPLLISDIESPKRVHLKATSDSGLSQGSANEETIDFDSEYHNDTDYFSHANGVVTVTESGLYWVFSSILYYNSTASARNTPLAYVKVNGVKIESTTSASYDRGNDYGRYSSNRVYTLLSLDEGDTVEIAHYAYNEDGTLYFDASGSEFIVAHASGIKGETGSAPEHEWNGPYLRFKNPDGSWGDWQNLQVDGEGEQISLPIGYVYFQLPGKDDPSTMNLAGTWEDISSEYEGRFFRVAGGAGGSFGDTQADQNKSHRHAGDTYVYISLTSKYLNSGRNFNSGGNAEWLAYTSNYTSYEGGSEARPISRTMKVWERTS